MKRALALGGTAALLTLAAATAVEAQENQYYIAGSIGGSFLEDSDNSGSLRDGLDVTGTGSALDGTTFTGGSGLGWTTEYDEDLTYSLAGGLRKGPYRFEAELAYTQSDADSYRRVRVGGNDLTSVDAAIFDEGQTTPVGTTVGELNADGDLSTTYLFANAYRDFDIENLPVTPYIGAGIGVGFVEVDYNLGGESLVDDDDTLFAYQVMAGASYDVNEQVALFGEAGYRGTTDVEIDTDLVPGSIDIENRGAIAEIGLRYSF